jgi:iron only hydrogenase large subunit-like protein
VENVSIKPEPRDDTNIFFEDLKNGVPIRVLVSPTAEKYMQDFPHYLGYLRSKGVSDFHQIIPFADITVWMHYRAFLAAHDGLKIDASCAGARWYLKSLYPKFAQQLASVASPMICAAQYLRAYRGYTERFAFVSPCPYKWIEFACEGEKEPLVHYNVTIKGLINYIRDRNIDIRIFPRTIENSEIEIPGITLAAYGTMEAALRTATETMRCEAVAGLERIREWVLEHQNETSLSRTSDFLEPYYCENMCLGGEASIIDASFAGNNIKTGIATPGKKELEALFSRFDRELDPSLFRS